jgi:hypothetical protein
VSFADRTVHVLLKSVKNERRSNSLIPQALTTGVRNNKLEKQQLTALKVRIPGLTGKREHPRALALSELGHVNI